MPSYPIWSSGSTDAMSPQIYNWAAADRAEQSANIGRQTDWDRQAINNANQYYQFARGNENQDFQRQHEAEQQSYARQLASDELARRQYQFGQEQKLQADYLKKQDEWKAQDQATKLLIDNFKTSQVDKQAREGGISWLHENLGAGKHMDKSDSQLAQMSGVPAEQVAAIADPYRTAFPDQMIAKLNARVSEMVAKTDPKKLNVNGISGLSSELPASVQKLVSFNPATMRFERTKLNPVMGDVRMNNDRYSFGSPTETATTPATAPLMQYGNQGGGYFQPSSPREASAAPMAPVQNAPVYESTYSGEAQARAAGHQSGDIVRIVGVGKVRLR